jgi:hypothetical protein
MTNKKVKQKRTTTARVRPARPHADKVDPESVREWLGADPDGIEVGGGSPFTVAALRAALFASLTSSGGRPTLSGSSRRPKIPMSDQDWQTLDAIAVSMSRSGRAVTPPQVAAQLLRDAVVQLRDAPPSAYVVPNATPLRCDELAKDAVVGAWKYRRGTTQLEHDAQTEHDAVLAHAVRVMGSILFEMRSNVERVRFMAVIAEEDRATAGAFDFAVSDALLGELCRVAPAPQVIQEYRLCLSALRRIDELQRAALQPASSVAQALARRSEAIAFVRDALDKNLLERFNRLHAIAAGVGNAAHGDAWSTIEASYLPDAIDAGAAIDHTLIEVVIGCRPA